MAKGNISISVQNRMTLDISRKEVPAEIFGAFGVHESLTPYSFKWQVSHVASGLAVGGQIHVKSKAIKFARLLNQHSDKFTTDKADGKLFKQLWQQAGLLPYW